MTTQAVIFDLDGVLTDTAKGHYLAWKRLADEIGAPFDEAANEALKGVDRMGSLDLILRGAGMDLPLQEKRALAERKNGYYRQAIEHYGPADLFDGARQLLRDLRAAGIKTALASASLNAPFLLERMQVADLFDAVADPAACARGKPDPEIFLQAARRLGVQPRACVGVEDAPAGVAAIKAAGMRAVGVGDPQLLRDADDVVARIADLRLQTLLPPQ